MPQIITKDDAVSPADVAENAKAAQAAFESVDESPVKQSDKPEKVVENQEPTPDPAVAAKAASDAEWDGVPVKVRQTLETVLGKIGGIDELAHIVKSQDGRVGAALRGITELKSELDTARAAAKSVNKSGGDAPTQAQISAAAASDEEWEKLLEEFPDWRAGIDKRIDHRVEARIQKIAMPSVDLDGLKNEITNMVATAEARAEITAAHKNWKKTLTTPEFNDFVWNHPAAPSKFQHEDYLELKKQDPAKAAQFFDGFARTNPQWWAERGAMMASDEPEDAIRLLDAYSEHSKTVADATAKAERSKKRLDSAITPKGVATAQVNRNLTEDEAKLQGFLSVDS